MVKIKFIEIKRIEGFRDIPLKDLRNRNVRVNVHISNKVKSFKKEDNEYVITLNTHVEYLGIGYLMMDFDVYLDPETAEEEFNSWKSTGKISEEILNTILSAVYSGPIIDLMLIAKILSLPPPIPLQVSIKKSRGDEGSTSSIGVM